MNFINSINPMIIIGVILIFAFLILSKIVKSILRIAIIAIAIFFIAGGGISTFNLKKYASDILPNIQSQISSYAKANGINLTNPDEKDITTLNNYIKSTYPKVSIRDDNGSLVVDVSKGSFLNFKTSITLNKTLR